MAFGVRITGLPATGVEALWSVEAPWWKTDELRADPRFKDASWCPGYSDYEAIVTIDEAKALASKYAPNATLDRIMVPLQGFDMFFLDFRSRPGTTVAISRASPLSRCSRRRGVETDPVGIGRGFGTLRVGSGSKGECPNTGSPVSSLSDSNNGASRRYCSSLSQKLSNILQLPQFGSLSHTRAES
jgi:hypothetical protein